MGKTAKSHNLWMGFRVQVEPGPVPRPLRVEFWKPTDYKGQKPEKPLHYQADALTGLSLYLLHPEWLLGSASPDQEFPRQAWQELEPMFLMAQRSLPRVAALRKKTGKTYEAPEFEKTLQKVLNSARQSWGFDLLALHDLVEEIDELEARMERPLLYNLQLELGMTARYHLQHLQSFLFNLRTLVAMDYNAYIQDPAHEALKVDSITDYLPRPDYVANDALLYFEYKKLRKGMAPEAARKMDHAFMTYSHNSTFLIESLPETFLSKQTPEELTESLYLVQMDWLMGTEAGLLYQIREEIYGLIEGYHKIFFSDYLSHKRTGESPYLEVQCQVDPSLLIEPSVKMA